MTKKPQALLTTETPDKKTMENCIEFKLPFVVDTNLGDSWGQAK